MDQYGQGQYGYGSAQPLQTGTPQQNQLNQQSQFGSATQRAQPQYGAQQVGELSCYHNQTYFLISDREQPGLLCLCEVTCGAPGDIPLCSICRLVDTMPLLPPCMLRLATNSHRRQLMATRCVCLFFYYDFAFHLSLPALNCRYS